MVDKVHEHTNKEVLDKLSANSEGKLIYDNEIIAVGANGARKMSIFSQKVESLSSTFILDAHFDNTVDTLWRVHYNGVKLIETIDYIFDKSSKTITFLNEFQPSINRFIVITKYKKVA